MFASKINVAWAFPAGAAGPSAQPSGYSSCRCVRARRHLFKPFSSQRLHGRQPPQASAASAVTVDRSLFVKISMAGIKGALDLSEMDLEEIPPEIFDLKGLKDLTLAGNRIREIPSALGRLTSLERLQLAGNCLTSLPDAIGELPRLQGLWVHGNLLQSIPASIGALTSLQTLSLAGNCLETLPEEIGALLALEDLGVSGNELRALPQSIGRLSSLKKLACNGNLLEELPESVGELAGLQQLWLQCNKLRRIDPVSKLQGLVTFSAADNPTLTEIPTLQQLTALKNLELYGCGLTSICPEALQLPNLRSAWLEGNPLQAESLSPLLATLPQNAALKDLGLDTQQVVGINEDALALVAKQVQPGEIIPGGRGYFKISSRRDLSDSLGAAGEAEPSAKKALVVAFGSAPGVPNWGGLLKRVELAGAAQPDWASFDILYVVDGSRSWYEGGDEGANVYRDRLQSVCERYETVVMLGDSMGASAALLFAPLATAVLAFCPQVDLNTSSIRPGKSRAWLDVLRQNIRDSVQEAALQGVKMVAHTGSWEHDVVQARNLPKEHVHLKVHAVDSHRLAYYLDKHSQLVPLVLNALKQHRGAVL